MNEQQSQYVWKLYFKWDFQFPWKIWKIYILIGSIMYTIYAYVLGVVNPSDFSIQFRLSVSWFDYQLIFDYWWFLILNRWLLIFHFHNNNPKMHHKVGAGKLEVTKKLVLYAILFFFFNMRESQNFWDSWFVWVWNR